jgi:hypothetical protein
MVAVLVLVSEEEPDEVWVTFVSAAESLKNFDLSLIFFSLFSMKCFDGEVLFIGALITWNNVLVVELGSYDEPDESRPSRHSRDPPHLRARIR